MNTVPLEVLVQIFFFLPGDLLLVLRGVCRQWHHILHIERESSVDVYLRSKARGSRGGSSEDNNPIVTERWRPRRKFKNLEQEAAESGELTDAETAAALSGAAELSQQQQEDAEAEAIAAAEEAAANESFSLAAAVVRSRRRAGLPQQEAMTGLHFWSLLCEQQFRQDLMLRRRYPSQLRPLVFYLLHWKERLIREVTEQEKVLESLESHLESVKVSLQTYATATRGQHQQQPQLVDEQRTLAASSRLFHDAVCISLDTIRLLMRLYNLERFFERIDMREHEWSVMRLPTVGPAAQQMLHEFIENNGLVSPNAKDADGNHKRRFAVVVKVNDEMLNRLYLSWIDRRNKGQASSKMIELLDLPEQEAKFRVVSQKLTTELQRWNTRNRDELLTHAVGHHSLLLCSEYDLSEFGSVALSQKGFSYRNYLRMATGKLKRSTIYAMLLQNTLE